MLIEEENFRNLMGKYIIIKNEEAAQTIAKTYEIVKIMEKEGDFTGDIEDIEANEDANAFLAIPYIDHTAGFSFGVLEVLYIDENNHFDIIRDEEIKDIGIANVRRKEGLEDSEFIYLEEAANYDDLNLKKYANEENVYVNDYTDDNLRFLRSIKELDPFRDDTFPDDIMVIFMLPEDSENEDTIMEGMWVRVDEYKEGLFYGTLLNTPNDERFNLKTGDEVRFIYDDNGQTPVCLAIPMKDKW